MKFQAVKGTQDFFGSEAARFHEATMKARARLERWGYTELMPPILESSALFARSIGETSDIVEKEIYTFEDKGGRHLSLRPEGTAGAARAFIQNCLDQKGLFRLFYMGPMFRAERPQAGRFRQFHQVGAEFFGNGSALADVEIILLAGETLSAMGIESATLLLNSLGCRSCRPSYIHAVTKYLRESKGRLCEDCQRRIEKNPLRALDCKVDGPGFSGPGVAEFWCVPCRLHFEEVLEWVKKESSLKVEVRDSLVRGLDYYTRTIFEIVPSSKSEGSQAALCAGGRYDHLLEDLGGQPMPAVGFAVGIERVLEVSRGNGPSSPPAPSVFVALMGKEAARAGLALSRRLHESGRVCVLGDFEKSLKSQLRKASDMKAKFAILIGEDEIRKGAFTVRHLEDHHQESIPPEKVVEYIKEKIHG